MMALAEMSLWGSVLRLRDARRHLDPANPAQAETIAFIDSIEAHASHAHRALEAKDLMKRRGRPRYACGLPDNVVWPG